VGTPLALGPKIRRIKRTRMLWVVSELLALPMLRTVALGFCWTG
jgi:hypothetical protein